MGDYQGGLMTQGPTLYKAELARKEKGSKGLLDAVGQPLAMAPGLTGLLGNALLAARYFTGEQTPQSLAQSVSDATPGLLTQAIAAKYPVVSQAVKVYHGSPALFEKFDPNKIGSGEGSQAYGYGHYVAENPLVAKEYQKLNQGEGGKLYTVHMPDEAASKMLDWDKPMSQQSTAVKDALRGVGIDPDKLALSTGKDLVRGPDSYLFKDLVHSSGQSSMEGLLQKSGITGIKYLDQGSRAAGSGTSNYVVFPGNEGLLNIVGHQ